MEDTTQAVTKLPPQKATEDSWKDVAKWLLVLAEALAENIKPERIDIYLEDLSDLSPAAVCAVLKRMRKTARWFPKIPDIREAVLGKPQSPAEVETEMANQAWEQISMLLPSWRNKLEMEADCLASGFSCYRAELEIPNDPVIKNAVRRLGGARAIASTQDRNLSFVRKDFIEAHRQVSGKSDMGQLPEWLGVEKFPLKLV